AAYCSGRSRAGGTGCRNLLRRGDSSPGGLDSKQRASESHLSASPLGPGDREWSSLREAEGGLSVCRQTHARGLASRDESSLDDEKSGYACGADRRLSGAASSTLITTRKRKCDPPNMPFAAQARDLTAAKVLGLTEQQSVCCCKRKK